MARIALDFDEICYLQGLVNYCLEKIQAIMDSYKCPY